ncbi:chorismate mutase [Roseibium denhamense]|uniref:chorismate mutase n=1 Tax=Roseibium denhamense TaxID=76305 RepID=UPI0012BBC69F|nr:chorismate mutase [Roseibium denhamense]MTI07488.1 chorismate mutase [Roseibium denhamense]
MSDMPDSGQSLTELRHQIDVLDAQIHDALIARARAEAGVYAARQAAGESVSPFYPDRDADVMRHLIERHSGDLPLVTVEQIWRGTVGGCTNTLTDYAVHLDGSAELTDMLDLARFYFGFSVELVPASDAADVVGAVTASPHDLGIVALTDRADLPWWRGLSDAGALVSARLPFVVMDDRPADLPALVLSKSPGLAETADVSVFDARWSDILPGKLMDQGIEVLSFFRSAAGVDAMIAVSGDLTEEDVQRACALAGAAPEVLRRIGGYAAPIDGDGASDEFGPEDEGS